MAKLYFRYSTMGAGKSLQLMAAAHNYNERGMAPLILNYKGDTRYGDGKVASRTGLQMDAELFSEETHFIRDFDALNTWQKKPDAIFIDEAQFLTGQQVEQLHDIATHWSIPVLCYGLRTDFLGRLFEGSYALMAHAETIEEIKTICDCGCKATHVRRYKEGVVQTTGDVIQIGDLEYKPMCYSCFRAEDISEADKTSLEENGK